jgi:hypothetical protein
MYDATFTFACPSNYDPLLTLESMLTAVCTPLDVAFEKDRIFLTECIDVFRVILRVYKDYFHGQH